MSALWVMPSGATTASLPSNCVQRTMVVTCTFSYNGTNGSDGSAQTFVVPPGVTHVTIEAWGAQAGLKICPADAQPCTAGLGGHVKGTFRIASAATLVIRVGGQPTGSTGGFNGGGAGKSPGGGASDVRIGGGGLGDRVAVAGGGGGAGLAQGEPGDFGMNGGYGGGEIGGDGGCFGTLTGCGGGASQTAGGHNGGANSCGGALTLVASTPSGAGAPGRGGDGGSVECALGDLPFGSTSGGGGGGGWFGGGGGAAEESAAPTFGISFAGGGGSGYVSATATGAINESSVRVGNGLVTITYPRPDTAAPSCTISAVISGPPKQLKITTRDVGSGLQSISASRLVNSTIDIPHFSPGTTDAVIATATKIDQSKASIVELTVKDRIGNTTVCDPVLLTLLRADRAQTVPSVDRAEHVVTVRNGAPGVRLVDISVNGSAFRLHVGRNEQQFVDVSRAMNPGTNNTITLAGHGPKEGAADIVIWDGNGSI
jgi:hypothetical protein